MPETDYDQLRYRIEPPLHERIQRAAQDAGRQQFGTFVRATVLAHLDATFAPPSRPDPHGDSLVQRVIYVTPDERARIQDAAQRAGINTSRWIRGVLRELFPQPSTDTAIQARSTTGREDDMQFFEEGQTWPSPIPPDRCCEYQWRRSRHDYWLFRSNPDEREVSEVKKGLAGIGLLVRDHVLVFLLRLGLRQWHRAYYHYQMNPAANRPTLDDLPTPESRWLLNVTLIDRDTRIVRALRMIAIPPDVSRVLVDAVRSQAADNSFRPELFHSECAALQQRYPNLDAMVRDCTITGWGGK